MAKNSALALAACFSQPLGFEQGDFSLLALGNVLQGFNGADHFILLVAQRRGSEEKPAVEFGEITLRLDPLRDKFRVTVAVGVKLVDHVTIFADDQIGHHRPGIGIKRLPLIFGPDHLAGWSADDLFAGLVPMCDGMAGIDHKGRDRAAIDDLGQRVTGAFQLQGAFLNQPFQIFAMKLKLAFGLDFFRNVTDKENNPGRLAAIVQNGGECDGRLERFAIAPLHAQLAIGDQAGKFVGIFNKCRAARCLAGGAQQIGNAGGVKVIELIQPK